MQSVLHHLLHIGLLDQLVIIARPDHAGVVVLHRRNDRGPGTGQGRRDGVLPASSAYHKHLHFMYGTNDFTV